MERQSTPLFLPGKSHGHRSLVGCSPQGCQESDRTEQLNNKFTLILSSKVLKFDSSMTQKLTELNMYTRNKKNYCQRGWRASKSYYHYHYLKQSTLDWMMNLNKYFKAFKAAKSNSVLLESSAFATQKFSTLESFLKRMRKRKASLGQSGILGPKVHYTKGNLASWESRCHNYSNYFFQKFLLHCSLGSELPFCLETRDTFFSFAGLFLKGSRKRAEGVRIVRVF